MLGFSLLVAGANECVALGQTVLSVCRRRELPMLVERATESEQVYEIFPVAKGLFAPAAPALLAAMMRNQGVAVSAAEVSSRIFSWTTFSTVQKELIHGARRMGFLPYVNRSGFANLVAQLDSGTPVLVVLNRGTSAWPLWRYFVVVALDSTSQAFVLVDGDDRRVRMSAAKFLQQWQNAGFWSLSLCTPGAIPEYAAKQTVLHAAIDFEQVGQLDDAWTTYQTATERWPEDPTPWIGLGNVCYLQGRYQQAIDYYRNALHFARGSAAIMINLAWALALSGERPKALALLRAAEKLADERWQYRIHLCKVSIRHMPHLPSRSTGERLSA